MTNQIMFWATVLSPIVGVIAIIVALIIAHGSSKDVKSQIDAINKQIDIFIAAQNPQMTETKRQLEQQLAQLSRQIKEAEIDLETVHYPFYGRGARIDDIEADMENQKRREYLQSLLSAKNELENKLNSINMYLSKAGK